MGCGSGRNSGDMEKALGMMSSMGGRTPKVPNPEEDRKMQAYMSSLKRRKGQGSTITSNQMMENPVVGSATKSALFGGGA